MSNKTGSDRSCQICGKVFYVPGWRGEVKYCSRKCAGSGRPKRRGNPQQVFCHHCSLPYFVPLGRVKTTKFCSQKCAGLANLPRGEEKRVLAVVAANRSRALPPGVRAANKKAGLARWYRENKDKVAEYGAKRYVEKKDQVQASNKSWYIRNADKVSDAGRVKRKDPVKGEKIRENRRQDYRKNKSAYVARARKREIDKLRATPLWADLDAIEEFYRLADKLTRDSGIPYHVDHIVPLRGKTVCGLHVENNLQVITKAENLEKGNRFNPENEMQCQEH